MTDRLPELPAALLPFAVFDEFGKSADDRVQDYCHAIQLAAYRAGMLAAAQIAESHLVGGIEGRESETRVYDCEVGAAIRRAAEEPTAGNER